MRNKLKSGRPKTVTKWAEKALCLTPLRYRPGGSTQLAQKAAATAAHPSSVQRHLIKQGLCG